MAGDSAGAAGGREAGGVTGADTGSLPGVTMRFANEPGGDAAGTFAQTRFHKPAGHQEPSMTR